jgi:hypothetical protein
VEGSINGQHLSWIAVIMMLLTAVACTDSPTAPPLSTPPSLESSTLFSGGEGILVSESYRSIELAPLIDSLEVVSRRWSNFHVLFAGDTVDSWRVSEDRIAFRVPPSYSGDFTVEIDSPELAPPTNTVQSTVIGAATGYAAGWGCLGGFDLSAFLPINSDELLLWTECVDFVEGDRQGVVRLRPSRLSEPISLVEEGEWFDELSFDPWEDYGDRFRNMWAVGSSFREGHAVVERYPDSATDSSTTWIWRFGFDPAPVERIDCLPPNSGWGDRWGYTAAEIAPGVCLSLSSEGVHLNGSQLLAAPTLDWDNWRGLPSFRVANDGTAALRSIWFEVPGWPVFRPDVGMVYMVEDYSAVIDVAFSPQADTMYAIAMVGVGEAARPVLDVRDTSDGALEYRVELEGGVEYDSGCGAAIAHDGEHLWTLGWLNVEDATPEQAEVPSPCLDESGMQVRLELRDPTDLSVLRSVALPRHPIWESWPVAVGSTPVLVPDGTGRRAYIFGAFTDHAATGYLMEMY